MCDVAREICDKTVVAIWQSKSKLVLCQFLYFGLGTNLGQGKGHFQGPPEIGAAPQGDAAAAAGFYPGLYFGLGANFARDQNQEMQSILFFKCVLCLGPPATLCPI